MNYYRIYHSTSENIIGERYPQVEKVVIPTTWDDPNYIGSYVFEKPTENVLVPQAVLSPKAMMTDLVSASSVGLTTNLLISNRLKNHIENSKHSSIIFFKTEIIQPKLKQETPYWILHSYDSCYETLDLRHSTFSFVKDELSMKITAHIDFQSAKQIRDKYKEIYNNAFRDPPINEYLIIDKIIFTGKTEIDFFSLRNVRNGGIGYFVSEKLKNEIEKEGCTGIVFWEPNEPYP